MAYTYADYDNATLYPDAATRLARCRSFMAELRQLIGAARGSDGENEDPRTLNDLLKMAREDADKLDREIKAGQKNRVGFARFSRRGS